MHLSVEADNACAPSFLFADLYVCVYVCVCVWQCKLQHRDRGSVFEYIMLTPTHSEQKTETFNLRRASLQRASKLWHPETS